MNLWEPADGPGGRDFGTSGRFTARSWHRDPQIAASRHHGLLAGLGAAAAAALAGLSSRR